MPVYEKIAVMRRGRKLLFGLLFNFLFPEQMLQEKSLMKIPAVVFSLALMSAAAHHAFAQETQWQAITEQGIAHYGKGEYERAVAAIKKSLAMAEKQLGQIILRRRQA